MEIEWLAYFWSNFEIDPIFICLFFNRKTNFVLKQTFSKTIFACKYNFLWE